MEKTLTASLLLLGCDEKHIRFYRANLELGAAPLVEIAKKARLQRSTAYLIATEMVERGLANEDHKTYKKLFVAAEPDVILRKLEAKHRQIGRSTIQLKEVLPELRAAHQATTTRPRVRTFEGGAGLAAVWKDILAEQQEVLLWTNQQTEQLVFDAPTHELFIRERMAKQIPMRVLAVNNPQGETLLETDQHCLRQTKLLPAGTHFTCETYIYGNKIAVLDMGKTVFGVITENEQIAESQRAMFELTWQNQ